MDETCNCCRFLRMKSDYIVQHILKREWSIVSCMATVITQTYWTYRIFMCHFGVMYVVAFHLIMPVFRLQMVIHKYGSYWGWLRTSVFTTHKIRGGSFWVLHSLLSHRNCFRYHQVLELALMPGLVELQLVTVVHCCGT